MKNREKIVKMTNEELAEMRTEKTYYLYLHDEINRICDCSKGINHWLESEVE